MLIADLELRLVAGHRDFAYVELFIEVFHVERQGQWHLFAGRHFYVAQAVAIRSMLWIAVLLHVDCGVAVVRDEDRDLGVLDVSYSVGVYADTVVCGDALCARWRWCIVTTHEHESVRQQGWLEHVLHVHRVYTASAVGA